ncbi:acyl-CoA dehydrogenase family protein [Saccharothrix algeriensis]|uniref:Acyl-CoA dehydrogenase family protein n=1 Tax=Saccharothrix algeriensis TaxID=173560 RepID=A0A8T8I3A7_9PSEU|nr:acyl-CoA dehydrogenase family protein [Saccharothrix algeriensis]MBM7810323.1 alkylation response protein AidB-like acyl-CoA dehydrogenase [Saccharothrix algeriensis]QTR04474.1 acyl-CoA dehydrogenase family protein [Saccharothrix algeriensis]
MTLSAQHTWHTTPTGPEEWVARAQQVATLLATDAVARDRAGATPHAEVRLLKDAGLVTLLGPAEHGGGGQDWTTAYRVTREVAAGDGSIGQLIGYHYLWSWAARLVATPEQVAAVEERATRERWFFGGAVNPRDDDLVITEEGDELVFTGRKSFSTGGKVSDVTVLEGVLAGTDRHVFAIVPSHQDGIVFEDDWDNLGQRLTESGGVRVEGVRVPWSQAAGYVDGEFRPRTYNTLNVPLIQLVFTNFYLGIAKGALTTAAAYTKDKTRPWPYALDVKSSAVEEFHVLETYGDLQAKLWAAEALADRAAGLIEAINAHADEVTERERGEAAVVIAAAKQRAIDTGLEIGNRVFEVTGARATANSVGLDIFWRNIRTHSLHDPIAHKRAEVGRYALLGEIPEPTWYT